MPGQRPNPSARPRAGKAAGISALVLAAAALAAKFAAPITMESEGMPTDRKGNAVAYVDKLGKGQPVTICFGMTGFVRGADGKLVKVGLGMKVPPSQCRAWLEQRQAQDALPIYEITPGIAEYPRCWGAIIDFTHNFNVEVYRRSSIARHFNAGRWKQGADALLLYNKGTVGGRLTVLPGLVARRQKERAECLADFAR